MSAIIPFDDRDGFIWLDGRLVDWRDANCHVLTHSLHYASSIFEGIRAYDGHIFKLTEHSQRLLKSAEYMGYALPYSVEELNKACEDVIKANGFSTCYLRPVAWRGSEVMGVSARASRIHVAVAAWEWPSYFSVDKNAPGLKLKTSKWRRPAPNTAPVQSKAACLYAIGTLAKHAAEEEGFHDSLMLSWQGHVSEATGANLFLVMDNKLHTPIPDCFLDGITRRTVMSLAKSRGIEVIERVILPEELATAKEIFVTGTAAEVTAVTTIDNLKFPYGTMTQLLQEDYFKLSRAKM